MKLSQILLSVLILILPTAMLVAFQTFKNTQAASVGNIVVNKQVAIDEQDMQNKIQDFLPKKLSWNEVSAEAPWEPRDSGTSFVFQDKLWMMGGLNGNKKVQADHTIKYWEAEHFNDIWNTVDGVNWRLAQKESAWAPRRSMSVVFFKGKLWMFGGWSPVTGYTSDIWQSNDGVNWEMVGTGAWPAREGQTSEIFQNKIWLIGGVNYNERQTKNDVWYSENGTDWTQVENIPWKPRWDHATAVFNGKLFLTAGMNLAGETFQDVWVSEDGMKWQLVTDVPPWMARQGHTLLSFKNKLWLIGRLDDSENGGVNDVWYSGDGVEWEKTSLNPKWRGREDFFSAVFKDRMWVFGGMGSDWKWKNDVWASEQVDI